ncbi:MAG: hypothetical protein KF691_10915 [Phycisphaeraceae bacterium]|nr:hypothetical protein [Phycisphaeraceae bacterium]
MNQPDPGGRLLSMLATQHDLLATVGELSLVQARVIEEDEPEQLVAVLEQRSKVLEKATALSREIDAGMGSLAPDDPQLALIQQRRRAVADLARQIAETDRQHGVALARKRDELARALAGMNSSRAAATAYAGAPGPVDPGFQDRSA